MDVTRLSDGLMSASIILAFLSVGELLRAWLNDDEIYLKMGDSLMGTASVCILVSIWLDLLWG